MSSFGVAPVYAESGHAPKPGELAGRRVLGYNRAMPDERPDPPDRPDQSAPTRMGAAAMPDQALPIPDPLTAANDIVRGAGWMVIAALFFAGMIGVIRHLAAELHPLEIAFFRNLFGFAFMLPWLLRTRFEGLRTQRLGLFGVRAVIGLGAMTCWFWAVSIMPLAEAVALNFTAPLFTTVFAVIFLHEVVRLRRWSATIIGFIGALVILRPGLEAIQPAAFLALGASVFMGAAKVCIKELSKTESNNAIVTYMVLFLTPMSLVPALFVWQTPGWHLVPWLIALGGLATLAHQCMVRAFRAAEASAVIPFDYARLPFTALIGWLAFGQVADAWTWIGAAIIASAGMYIAHREAQLARAAARGAAPAKASSG